MAVLIAAGAFTRWCRSSISWVVDLSWWTSRTRGALLRSIPVISRDVDERRLVTHLALDVRGDCG
jgi:hypothetical protein